MRLVLFFLSIAFASACTQPQAEQAADQTEPVTAEMERLIKLIEAAQPELDLKLPSMQIRPPLRVTPYASDALDERMLEQLEALMSELHAVPVLPQESGSGMR